MIICDVPLPTGTKLLVWAFDDQFQALAIVRHVSRRRDDGNWTLGVEFAQKEGRWIVA